MLGNLSDHFRCNDYCEIVTVTGSFTRRDFSNRVEFSHLPVVNQEKAMEVLKPGEDSLLNLDNMTTRHVEASKPATKS